MTKYNNEHKFLLLVTLITSLCFSGWNVLLNNFANDIGQLNGQEIGILQSLREVPGLLVFTVIFVLFIVKEQTLLLFSILLFCIGISITGFFPSVLGLYLTTFIMSVGYHYIESINNSLTLQMTQKEKTASFLSEMMSVKSLVSVSVYFCILAATFLFEPDYKILYLIIGGVGIAAVIYLIIFFPVYEQKEIQRPKLILKRNYYLFYILTFLNGARRQIFIVFAVFMMVDKFGMSLAEMSILFTVAHLINWYMAPKAAFLIKRLGEKHVLKIEYAGLTFVFIGYALTNNIYLASVLYIIDHLFFALSIALNTYFQKIAEPQDISSTTSVSFTINHIAAVILPAVLGGVWLHSPSAVFIIGGIITFISFLLATSHDFTTSHLKTKN